MRRGSDVGRILAGLVALNASARPSRSRAKTQNIGRDLGALCIRNATHRKQALRHCGIMPACCFHGVTQRLERRVRPIGNFLETRNSRSKHRLHSLIIRHNVASNADRNGDVVSGANGSRILLRGRGENGARDQARNENSSRESQPSLFIIWRGKYRPAESAPY